MFKPIFDKGLFGELRDHAGDVWQAYTRHEFLEQLARGTLPEVCFKRYLTQDYLFLIHFSRAYALLAAKSTCLNDIKDALAGLKAIADEMPLHVSYCKKWGITEQEMVSQTEASETIAYTRFVLDVGHIGDRLDLMAALLPCVAGYAEIGLRLAQSQQTVFIGNPYADWIKNYESEDYCYAVQAAIDMLNRLGEEDNSSARFQRLSEIFTTATRLEADFWQMALAAK